MKKRIKKIVSVDGIAKSAAQWAFVATGVFVAVFLVVQVTYGLRSSIEKEDRRLKTIAPAVARSVASELLVGDEKSLSLLREELKRRFNLTEIELVKGAHQCTHSGHFWIGVRRALDENCMLFPMHEIGPSRFLLVRSQGRDLEWASSLTFGLWFCIPLLLFGVFVRFRIRRELKRSIVEPIQKLAVSPEKWKETDPRIASEITALHEKLKSYIRERDNEKDKARALKTQASIGDMAAQVAHDIRSPLAALDMLASSIDHIPEDKRVLMRSALSRIRDIANGLIDRQRAVALERDSARHIEGQELEKKAELLSSLVDTLISEKRMQYRGRLGLEIELCLTPRAYGLFSVIHGTELKRVLSNLIDNAVEAVEEQGRVAIEMYSEPSKVFILVRDNGKGIKETVLPKLMQKGKSFGKPGGAGLGLFHAKKVLEDWGGALKIDSKLGKGTTVELQLPRAPVPEWFAPELRLPPSACVVILDDDTSIHQIWRGRFKSLRAKERGIGLIHFSNESGFMKWIVETKPQEQKETVYLVDYELVGDTRNGIQLIADYRLTKRAILVTSRFEEPGIRSECRRLGIPLLPKSLAGFIPIYLEEKRSVTSVSSIVGGGQVRLADTRPSV